MPAQPPTTVADWRRRSAERLVAHGFAPESARQDLSVIGRHVLGWDMAAWLTRPRDPITPSTVATLDALVDRRARGEPVAYLTGEREFYGRPFRVSPAVLIPRPETELLIEVALDHLRSRSGQARPMVVDVGTGSGNIAITLALECPAASLAATDVSPSALAVARSNAVRHGVSDRILFRESGQLGLSAGSVDLIVSNPPYVPETDRESIPRDVRDFEPAFAVFGGSDGLDVIRMLVWLAAGALAPGGQLGLEIGAGQAAAVTALFSAHGFHEVAVRDDLAGHPRVVSGTVGAAMRPIIRP